MDIQWQGDAKDEPRQGVGILNLVGDNDDGISMKIKIFRVYNEESTGRDFAP